MRAIAVICLLALVIYMPKQLHAQNDSAKTRAEYILPEILGELHNGQSIRIRAKELGRLEGLYQGHVDKSIYLAGHQRMPESESMDRIERRRQHRQQVLTVSSWKKVDDETAIPLSYIKGLWVRGKSTGTGAIVGASIVGLAGFLIGSGFASMEGGGGEDVTLFVGGALVGGLIGALIGSSHVKWKKVY